MTAIPVPPNGPRAVPPVSTAMIGAALVVALTVAAKSARDALFCAQFPASSLPLVMIAGAGLSALLALASARVLRSWGPARALPLLLAANGLGFLAEYAKLPSAPQSMALALYLHVSAVTGLLISGFWSVVNERFDPHALRIGISRIGLGGTLGGVVGGLSAARVAGSAGARQTLLLLALLSGLGALMLRILAAAGGNEPAGSRASASAEDGGGLRSTYLRELALFVALTALASSVIDFAFKSRAMERYSNAEALVHFFALFYAGTSVAAFLVQAFVTRALLDRAGLGVALAGLPTAVAGFGLVALAVPSLAAQAIMRLAEGALSTSLFRSAYEPLYTPLSAERKRSAKGLIDVLINRLGDGLGSLLCWALVLLLPRAAGTAATGMAVAVAMATLFMVARLQRGYVAELAASLRSGAVLPEQMQVNDQTTRLLLSQTINDLDARRLRAEIRKLREQESLAGSESEAPAAMEPGEPVAALAMGGDGDLSSVLSDLLSRDVARIQVALGRAEPSLASFIIPLLSDQRLAAQAMQVLAGFGTRVTGQLADAVLDLSRPPPVRRRLLRVISASRSQLAAAALSSALDDPDREVRRQIVLSLSELADHGVPVRLPHERTLARAIEELCSDGGPAASRVEHALRLLGLIYEREAFRLAHAALVSDDSRLRGTGLEYLENVLPEAVRTALLAALATHSADRPRRPERELLDELKRTLG